MRRSSKVDANQKEVVDALRKAGATVKPVHAVKGFVDIVVGYKGRNWLMEIKDGNKPPSARKLTEMEQEFHDNWNGDVCIVESAEQAVQRIKELGE